ncbi:MAG TPA: tRNA lysidine(34) synthetase TilS [Legionella sp.]|nr:tRNA lysidine(34) synthetase TilS [Legionella sp.]
MTINLPNRTPCIELLASDWLQRLAGYRTLWVGLSGGLDSVVLLHQLAHQPDLTGRVRAVHIHHGLSLYADAWLHHCQSLCIALGVPLMVRHVEFDRRANIEANARHARFDAFAALMTGGDGLLLAHHADDQAETVLLQLFRGAGVDGMAAMPAVKPFGGGDVVRPFLMHTRHTLEAYARRHQLTWVEDDSNQDIAFSRNYLRHQIMPLLQEKWPGVVANLVRTAQHCQQAKDNLAVLASLDCARNGEQQALSADTLPLALIQPLDPARAANVLRSWLMNNSVRMPSTQTFNRLMTEVVLARNDARACVEWDRMAVRRYQQMLYLVRGASRGLANEVWSSFPECIDVGTRGDSLCASIAVAGLYVPNGSQVEVRFRQGGELFSWRGQTKSLKQLFQQWCVPPWQRCDVPLIYIDGHLAQVVGFAVSDIHYQENMPYTYHIELHREPLCHSH